MKKKVLVTILSILVIIGVFVISDKKGQGIVDRDRMKEVVDDINPLEQKKDGHAGVSASHPAAVEVGIDVLENGGNAVDAAIAVSYVLSVVEPYASGIGGGGETLIYAEDMEPVSYQYKEVSPQSGDIPANFTGVPGFVKGMEKMHEDFGALPIEELIEPAITYAEEGFKMNEDLRERLAFASYRLPIDQLPHLFTNGEPAPKGTVIKQPELAETLRTIQQGGADAFYKGEIGARLVEHVDHLTTEDLEQYAAVTSEPVQGEFNGYEVYSATPPLSGTTLIQALGMAEQYEDVLTDEQIAETDYIHLISEISKRAYKERQRKIGDPHFYDMDTEQLVSEQYIKQLAQSIDTEEISTDFEINDSPADEKDYDNTTHFVIIDHSGMVVSTTNTLSNFFGSGDYVDGYFLNNALENFSTTESSRNYREGGKSPRSFIAPTILVNDEQVIGIGSPGGKRIPSILTDVLVQTILLDRDIEEVVEQPRFFAEKDDLYMEEGFSEETRNELLNRGYHIYINEISTYFGGIQMLSLNKANEKIVGIADSRRDGDWDVAE
ncbi:MAG TPA: gamma-glutamyltransferase [Bacillota bacterium]